MYEWFKKGENGNHTIKRELIDGKDKDGNRQFSANELLKAEEGDVLFLGEVKGPWVSNQGHVVLIKSVTSEKDIKGNVVRLKVDVIGAYASGAISGVETMYLYPASLKLTQGEKTKTDKAASISIETKAVWGTSHNDEYTVLGIGQVKQPNEDADKPVSNPEKKE